MDIYPIQQKWNTCGTNPQSICTRTKEGQALCLREYSVIVNHQLETHRHPILSSDNLMPRLSSGYYFTKINLADAYNQVKLSPESQRRLAVSTHRSVLLQTAYRLAYHLLPGYIQEIMDRLTCDLQAVAVYLDDILVNKVNIN